MSRDPFGNHGILVGTHGNYLSFSWSHVTSRESSWEHMKHPVGYRGTATPLQVPILNHGFPWQPMMFSLASCEKTP